MTKEDLPVLTAEEEMYLNEPYGGLFGNSVMAKVVEELVADPTMDYRPKYLVDVTGNSEGSINKVLKKLLKLGLIENKINSKHPVYRVRVESKKFAALSFLAYAMLDDREVSDCMNLAISDYYNSVLREDYEPQAIANSDNWVAQPGIVCEDESEYKTISASA